VVTNGSVLSLAVSGILIWGSSGLVKRTVLVLMQSTPLSVDLESLNQQLLSLDGVIGLHRLHIWQLDEQRIVASVHVVCQHPSNFTEIAKQIRGILHTAGVHDATVQPEWVEAEETPKEGAEITEDCRLRCVSPECDKFSV